MKYKASIIVPCYNTKPWLDECLQSLVDQTLQEIEIICVNDGSTDGTGARLNEWQAQYHDKIKVIHQSNGGLSNASNAGMAIAQGECIGFVDSDDFVDINIFKILYDKVIKDNLDIAIANYKEYYRCHEIDNSEFGLFNTINTYDNKIHYKQTGDLFLTITRLWGSIFSTSFLKNNKIKMIPYKECCFAEEMPFIFQAVIHSKKVGVIKQVLYYYRQQRHGQLTQQFDERQFTVFNEFNYIRNNAFCMNNLFIKSFLKKQILIHICSIKNIKNTLKKEYLYKAAKDFFMHNSIYDIYKNLLICKYRNILTYPKMLIILLILHSCYLWQKLSITNFKKYFTET